MAVSANSKSSTTKPVKDANHPKRPSSSYLIFSNEMRQKVRSENPDMKLTEVMSLLGQMWKNLSDEQREVYVHQFEADKARYEQEMASYTPPPRGESSATASSLKKPKSDIKKPMNAYILFSNQQRPLLATENADLKFGDVTKLLAARWKSMSDSDRTPYVEAAESQKTEYQRLISTPAVTAPPAPAPAPPQPAAAPAPKKRKAAAVNEVAAPVPAVAKKTVKSTKKQAPRDDEEELVDEE